MVFVINGFVVKLSGTSSIDYKNPCVLIYVNYYYRQFPKVITKVKIGLAGSKSRAITEHKRFSREISTFLSNLYFNSSLCAFK